MPVRPPNPPFPAYKWRWATYTPEEGLNEPPVYLGVLRAMRRCEGKAKSSEDFFEELQKIEQQVRGRVSTTATLARDPERNLLRNSGQYWQALGLMEPTVGEIGLTEFGRRIAEGRISRGEFAATTVKSLTLPNPRVEREENLRQWQTAGLQLRPLQLILEVIIGLEQSGEESYLTPDELTRIVIPLAGEDRSLEEHVEAIKEFRRGALDLSGWPDCTPAANDERMAKEFLLFLAHHSFLIQENGRFVLNEEAREEVRGLLETEVTEVEPPEALEDLRRGRKELFIERGTVTVNRRDRRGQQAFRRMILREYDSECLLTHESIPQVLEAGHIIPVENNGSDERENGLCLRKDVHTLFDGGHIRIDRDGRVELSELAETSDGYSGLPKRIAIPSFVSPNALDWRWNYN